MDDQAVYEEVTQDPLSALTNVIKTAIQKIKNRMEIPLETIEFFNMKYPRLGRFYLLPKIHKRLHNVPGRPVISNCSYYTENISAYVEHHLKPLSPSVKSYIKDTNDFLLKLQSLPPLTKDDILCSIDVVGLYPNIPNEEGLAAIKKALDKRRDKKVSTESIVELAEVVLKNNVFEFNEKVYKQKRGTAIGSKMAPPYAIIFMDDLENKMLAGEEFKPKIWWRYIDDIFLVWEHGEENLE